MRMVPGVVGTLEDFEVGVFHMLSARMYALLEYIRVLVLEKDVKGIILGGGLYRMVYLRCFSTNYSSYIIFDSHWENCF